MTNEERKIAIKKQLFADFPDSKIIVEDDSGLHQGHQGNQGKGHFSVSITSNIFSGKSSIQRHRMVYQSMEELLKTDVHALSIQTQTF